MGFGFPGNRSVNAPLLLAVGAVAAALGMAANTMSADSNTFTTGSLDIVTTPTTLFSNLDLTAPGDSTGGVALTVQNLGTLDFRYTVAVNADNADGMALRDILVLTVKTKTANPCTAFDGTTLYRSSLKPRNGLVIGDPASGEQAGDRTLTAGTSEVLCFKVDLPATAPNSVQAASTSADFTFSAEQM